MDHLTQDTRVRVPSAARNGLRTAALLTAALVLLAYAEISSAQEPELGIQPNQAETTKPDVANGQAIAGKLRVGCDRVEPLILAKQPRTWDHASQA